MQSPQPQRRNVWLVLFGMDVVLSIITLVIFGAIGGLVMLVALNGFSEAQGGRILTGYAVVVLIGNGLIVSVCNWLIVRWRFGDAKLPLWLPVVPAVLVTLALALAGPPLSVLLIEALFAR